MLALYFEGRIESSSGRTAAMRQDEQLGFRTSCHKIFHWWYLEGRATLFFWLFAIHFLANQNGLAVGTTIIPTTDGQNWTEQTNPDTLRRTLLDVSFLNIIEGCIVGNQGMILYTSIGGTDWTIQADGLTSSLLTGVQFTSSTNGYITGNNMTLLKPTQSTSIEESNSSFQFQLYPNPASDILNLIFEEKKAARLQAYNIRGELMHGEAMPARKSSVQLDVSAWPEGMYLVVVQSGKAKATQKIIIDH